MCVILRLVIGCIFSCSLSTFANNILITDIVKTADNNWSVTYRSKTPISSIQFHHTPDHSRHDRWRLKTTGLTFQSLSGRDTVFANSGKTFTEVTFELTPTYTNLPKSYAPFSPYSDGSNLFHSGRFFACANFCSGTENTWYLTFSAPISDAIIINGMTAYEKVSWYDHNDGRKVYVGKVNQTNDTAYFAVVDPGLPKSVVDAFSSFIPIAIRTLGTRFPPIQTKPMLFASFGQTEGDRYGRQGGVLPHQIFMHWYGKISDEPMEELLWFFAHEVAHLYQGNDSLSISNKDAWIHEGHAEFVAGQLLLMLKPESKGFVASKRQQAREACKSALNKTALDNFADQGQYSDLYSCGHAIYQKMAKSNGNPEKIAFDFWLALLHNKKSSQEIGVDQFRSAASLYLDEAGLNELDVLILK
ncbi:hypothetical protein ACFSJY_14760 [Thalassotalea euphylliae]|uniref:hypothetical protein n=1 Tax=Thalassotalea euphylliae TaxID=1655234 RepID=UPI00363D6A7C